MNPQREEDLQRRLEKLEGEIKSSSVKFTEPEGQTQTTQSGFAKLNWHLERSRLWFNTLSGVKKLAVGGVAVLLSIVMLQTVFKLVASVISLALLAVLVYLGYKFFVSSSFQRKQ
ncbi:hypothetical protein [Cylindrospermum sp. FACHB-282]|uniref:hypothetical protein n=1 Tax=Cylindrospermum sp. FACHB-282 TaxID=2692794 RepID=UPI001686089E|nr:hypothetical protein [Cylindrospermum sp. FACHB-282]MBD2386972.1 hypothetical protein [Cylindrospermum sp. FACHB-282]